MNQLKYEQEYAHFLSIHLIADNIVLIKNAPQRSFSLRSILYLYIVSTCYQIRIREYYYFEIIFDKLEKERHQNQNQNPLADIVLRSANRYRSYHKPCSFEISDLKSAIWHPRYQYTTKKNWFC